MIDAPIDLVRLAVHAGIKVCEKKNTPWAVFHYGEYLVAACLIGEDDTPEHGRIIHDAEIVLFCDDHREAIRALNAARSRADR